MRLGELVAALAGGGLLALCFTSWFSAAGADLDAWQAFDFIDVVLALTAFVPIAVALVSITGLSVSLPPVGSTTSATFAVIAFVLVLYRIVDPPADAERELGVFAGLAAIALIFVGSELAIQEERPPVRSPLPE